MKDHFTIHRKHYFCYTTKYSENYLPLRLNKNLSRIFEK